MSRGPSEVLTGQPCQSARNDEPRHLDPGKVWRCEIVRRQENQDEKRQTKADEIDHRNRFCIPKRSYQHRRFQKRQTGPQANQVKL